MLNQKQKAMFAMLFKKKQQASPSVARLNSFRNILVDSGIFSKTLPAVSQETTLKRTLMSGSAAMSTL